MIDFMTVQEATQRWGVTERQVQLLYKGGKIEGTSSVRRNWIIYISSEKPTSGRRS